MEHEVKKVLSIGDLHQMPHWKIYIGNSAKGPVYCSSDVIAQPDTSVTWETSKVVLESYLNLLPVGMYTIHYKTKADEKLDKYCLTFQITETGNSAAVGGLNQPNPMNQQWMFGVLQNQFTAEIGKVTSEITARFERQALIDKYERKLEEFEKKLKEKKEKNTSFDWKELPGILDTAIEGWTKVKALKNNAAPNIAISGANEKNIPADAAGKKTEEEEEGFTGFHLSDDKLVDVYIDTMTEMIARNKGNHDETVIELYCLNQLRKDKAEMFDAFVAPELKKYKAALNEKLGTTTG